VAAILLSLDIAGTLPEKLFVQDCQHLYLAFGFPVKPAICPLACSWAIWNLGLIKMVNARKTSTSKAKKTSSCQFLGNLLHY